MNTRSVARPRRPSLLLRSLFIIILLVAGAAIG